MTSTGLSVRGPPAGRAAHFGSRSQESAVSSYKGLRPLGQSPVRTQGETVPRACPFPTRSISQAPGGPLALESDVWTRLPLGPGLTSKGSRANEQLLLASHFLSLCRSGSGVCEKVQGPTLRRTLHSVQCSAGSNLEFVTTSQQGPHLVLPWTSNLQDH